MKKNLSDVGHFNTSPLVWQLIAKHVDNNEREMPIIVRNMWIWYHVIEKLVDLLTLSKDALREEWTLYLINYPGEENFNDVGHFNSITLLFS
jgi:hypothetical protein